MDRRSTPDVITTPMPPEPAHTMTASDWCTPRGDTAPYSARCRPPVPRTVLPVSPVSDWPAFPASAGVAGFGAARQSAGDIRDAGADLVSADRACPPARHGTWCRSRRPCRVLPCCRHVSCQLAGFLDRLARGIRCLAGFRIRIVWHRGSVGGSLGRGGCDGLKLRGLCREVLRQSSGSASSC